MPLVVPGINSGGDSPQATWMNKLMGKKLGERSDEVVCFPLQPATPNPPFPGAGFSLESDSEGRFTKEEGEREREEKLILDSQR